MDVMGDYMGWHLPKILYSKKITPISVWIPLKIRLDFKKQIAYSFKSKLLLLNGMFSFEG
jgi:hypothetical protein